MDVLFEKFINDRLSPSELKALRERFNAASDEELASLLDCQDFENSDTESVSQSIIDETKSRIDNHLFGNISHKRVTPMRHFLRIAAAVIVPLILIGGIWMYVNSVQHRPTGICTVTTAKDETSSLLLPDGTSVKINGNSSFSFPSGFKEGSREVSFDGEAYFDVAKNPDAPFVISTPSMTVSVKGTAFNLLSRPGARYSELSLDNGSVTVECRKSKETVDVQPGTKIILDNISGSITVTPFDYHQDSSSWTSMELHFENATPEFLIDRIEQTYQTVLDPKIKGNIDENFTGTLPADDLEDALRIITRIYSSK